MTQRKAKAVKAWANVKRSGRIDPSFITDNKWIMEHRAEKRPWGVVKVTIHISPKPKRRT